MFLSGRSTGWVSRFSSTDEWIFLADQSAEETDGELKAKRTASRGAPKTRKKKRRHQTKKKRTNEGDAGARARATRLSLNFPEQKKNKRTTSNDVAEKVAAPCVTLPGLVPSAPMAVVLIGVDLRRRRSQ